MDFPFEKNINIGFSPVILNGVATEESIGDLGWFNTTVLTGQTWPMTECLTDETSQTEVSSSELFIFVETLGSAVLGSEDSPVRFNQVAVD